VHYLTCISLYDVRNTRSSKRRWMFGRVAVWL